MGKTLRDILSNQKKLTIKGRRFSQALPDVVWKGSAQELVTTDEEPFVLASCYTVDNQIIFNPLDEVDDFTGMCEVFPIEILPHTIRCKVHEIRPVPLSLRATTDIHRNKDTFTWTLVYCPEELIDEIEVAYAKLCQEVFVQPTIKTQQ